MITVKLTSAVRLRSQELPAGAVLALGERDAAELIAAGLAVAEKPVPATPTKKEKE